MWIQFVYARIQFEFQKFVYLGDYLNNNEICFLMLMQDNVVDQQTPPKREIWIMLKTYLNKVQSFQGKFTNHHKGTYSIECNVVIFIVTQVVPFYNVKGLTIYIELLLIVLNRKFGNNVINVPIKSIMSFLPQTKNIVVSHFNSSLTVAAF